MKISSHPSSIRRNAVAALLVAAAGLPTLALAQGDTLTPQERVHQERADCMAGRTSQARATCLYEARSVLRDLRRGKLELQQAVDPVILADNAMMRCQALAPEAQESCQRLVRGEGLRLGSVAEGAVVMWLASADATTTVSELRP